MVISRVDMAELHPDLEELGLEDPGLEERVGVLLAAIVTRDGGLWLESGYFSYGGGVHLINVSGSLTLSYPLFVALYAGGLR